MQLKKNILRQLFGQTAVAQKVPQNAVHHGLVRFHNIAKSGQAGCIFSGDRARRDDRYQRALAFPQLNTQINPRRFKKSACKPSRRENSTISSGMPYPIRVEYAHERRIRERNKIAYRVAHWPIWIWVFFLAPGPLTFTLFAHGPRVRNLGWLMVVLAGTGVAGLLGQLPGVEPRPYILHFCEHRPNPLYRRICYTFAWNALLNFAILNLAGLIVATATGRWYLKQIYAYAYFPLFLAICLLSAFGILPRVKSSTKGEGTERRYFYGAVWSIPFAQALLLLLWKTLPLTHAMDAVKLAAFVITLSTFGFAAALGLLPRTRPILPGELIAAD